MKFSTKKLCSATVAFLVFVTMSGVPKKSTAYAKENNNAEITLTDVSLNNSALQADITFPDYMEYVDDTLIVNNEFTFKGYEGQGKLYITCNEGVQGARVFVNGKEIDISEAFKNNGKMYEVDYSNVAKNDRNTIQVTNIEPQTGKVNIKIPYPEIIKGDPSMVNMDQSTLDLIDTIVNNDVKYGFTSAQLAIIKDGVMVKNSAYGTVNAYNQDGTLNTNSKKVTTDTLYDLASNTKMYATNYAIQKLVSDGSISITDKITKYFPTFEDGESDPIKGKTNLTIQNLLEHQGGFPADPQYHNDKFNQATQKPDQSVDNPLFSQDKETTLEMILKTPLQYQPGSKTVYSDVDFMLLGFIIEKVTGEDLDTYVKNKFYNPLGLNHITYNPLKNGFSKDDCAATELNGNTRDGAISFKNVRTDTLQGEVHDEKAYYSMNGVSGHAGLFSNAEDLAKLCQVMLNDGGYGNNKFFSKNTIEEFTKRKASSATWGLGWWIEGDNGRLYYFGPQSSSGTYGHQGWTGTLTVIDPKSNLIIVLLTNKINSPLINNKINANNFTGNKFTTSTLGTIPTLVYEAINNSNKQSVDANLAQMSTEKLKLYKKDGYDANPVLKSAYSMVDSVVTRAENRKIKTMVDYAKSAVAELDDATDDDDIIKGFYDRISNIEIVRDEDRNLEKIGSKVLESLPSANWQSDVTFPDYMGYVDDTLIVNGMFTFNGYQNQGKLYIKADPGVTSAKIFINGVEADTTAICKDSGTTFEVDYSKVAANDRNTIQVTNIQPQDRKINIKIPYAEVIQGKAKDVNMNQNTLDLIDTIINNDIKYGFTSAQVAVIKDGVMVKNSAYGTVNSYNQDGTLKTDSKKVTTDTLYDLASNTKMYATNYAIQKLVSDGKIKITDKITKYFPNFVDGANDTIRGKSILTIQNLLEHQGGFPADPQYHNDKFNQETQKPDKNVDNHLFSQDKATTLDMILKTPLQYQPGSKTVYSDVDFMLLGFIIEKVTGQDLDSYVEKTFYKPLGLNHITYNPLNNGFSKDDCAATELNGNTRDGAISFKNIRTNTLQGQVHDEKAYYAMNGVSGHAGLFSNAADLAKLCQVMVNGGGYGEEKFFSKNTISEFTKRKASSPIWGLGWWREGDNGRVWYFAPQSSSNTYGHQGWTGTLTVIDPESNLIIVLLTNKINSPVVDNKINDNNFLGNQFTTSTLGVIPTIIYEAINHNNQDAIDANVSQMVAEKFKLYAENEGGYIEPAVLKSCYSMIDTAISRAEQNKTTKNLAYAEEAVLRLNVEKNREQILLFNERLKAIGGTTVELPNYVEELAKLKALIDTSKPICDGGQYLGEHVYYQTESWNYFIKTYEAALEIQNNSEKANKNDILSAITNLENSKNGLLRVDKTELNRAIVSAKTKVYDGTVDKSSEEIKTSFKEALKEAKLVYEDKNATMQKVIETYNNLINNYKKLEIPVGNKEELNALIKMAKELNLDQYLTVGQDDFKNALEDAKKVATISEPVEIDVLQAYEKLYNAMMALVPKPDKTMLKTEIETAEKFELEQYTEDSIKKLNSALEGAKKINENEESTQKEVDDATKTLNESILAMVKGVDKSELKALVKKANGLDLTKYTDETVANFNKYLNEANTILSNGNIDLANQPMVSRAIENLKKSMDSLTFLDSSFQGGNNLDPNNGEQKENNKSHEDVIASYINSESKKEIKNDKIPKTGDNNNIVVFSILGIAALAGIVVLRRKNKLNF